MVKSLANPRVNKSNRGGMPEPGAPSPKDGQGTELVPGSVVGAGRFALVKELGRGGMGVVWLAADQRLNEWVALKLFPPHIVLDPGALAKMREETFKSRRLTHPNIIRIHDLFEAPDETPFISMEYVDGPSLAHLLEKRPGGVFPWEHLVPVLRQLCDALDYAHGEGVIHRDLKPANMLIDAKGRLKLADFGIAVLESDPASREEAMRMRSGTPAFMSPQQLNGEAPQASDDLYALGATLYMLLASRPPFYKGDVFQQVLMSPPPPPTDRLRELGRQNPIPPAVSALIMACLSKNPEQRPKSAGAVAEWVGLKVERSATEALNRQLGLAKNHSSRVGKAPKVTEPAAGDDFENEAEGDDGELELFTRGGTTVKTTRSARRSDRTLLVTLVTLAMIVAGLGMWISTRPPPRDPGSENDTRSGPDAVVLPRASWGTARAASARDSKPKAPWINSLGMRFNAVPDTTVLFCVWETRVRDFATFVKATEHAATRLANIAPPDSKASFTNVAAEAWRYPGFSQAPDFPVCNVSWSDAMAFCRWLTAVERRERGLAPGLAYRLPTDLEWCAAAGLPFAPGDTPVERSSARETWFSWGLNWPPPASAGNFAGSESSLRGHIENYSDPFPTAAPVGSFKPDKHGLFDLAGNVSEILLDWRDGRERFRVVRGGNWASGNLRQLDLNSSFGLSAHAGMRTVGFRIVLAEAGGTP